MGGGLILYDIQMIPETYPSIPDIAQAIPDIFRGKESEIGRLHHPSERFT